MSAEMDASSHGGGLIGEFNMEALDTLPPFDDALIPEALGILGFELNPAEVAAAAASAPEETGDEKRPRVPGGNQREVQKRYRERKKNHTKMLEQKVKELERKLAAFEKEKREQDDDGVIAHMAIGRVVGPVCCGTDEEGASDSRDLDLPRVCPLEHRQFMERLDPLVGRLGDLLERGAADAEIRRALFDVFAFCTPTKATGAFNSLQLIMNKHAAALNRERERASVPAEAGDSNGESDSRWCFGVSGGPLRCVAMDGTVMSKDELDAKYEEVCDKILLATSPLDVRALVDWRDEYLSKLSALYAERQRLGLQLASSGGALVVPVRDASADRTTPEGGGDEDTSEDTGSGSGSGASETTKADAYTVGILSPDSVSFPTQGARVVDVLRVTEALKRSVQDEIALKMDMSKSLMAERLNVRASARIIVESHPLLPDPLALATELKQRGYGAGLPTNK
jgi:hypothetical protein